MTKARELIEQLQKIDPESDIGVCTDTGGYAFSHVSLTPWNPHEDGYEWLVRQLHALGERTPIYIIS